MAKPDNNHARDADHVDQPAAELDLDALPMFDDQQTGPPSGPRPPAASQQPGEGRRARPADVLAGGYQPQANPPQPYNGTSQPGLDSARLGPASPAYGASGNPLAPDLEPALDTDTDTSTGPGPGLGSDAGGWNDSGATSDSIDWGLVRALRQQAADRLSAAISERDGLDEQGRHELGRSIVLNLLTDRDDQAQLEGQAVFDPDETQAIARAVFDSLFGLGRLQPLVNNPEIENIEIFGADQVLLEYADGRLEEGPPVADSDDELIDTLAFLASRSQVNERPFSPSHPELHLRLDDGSRLAAWAWTTPRPAAVIRRHRLRQVTLQDLVDLGSMDPIVASFLAAAVRSKKSVVVSGAQGAGKTTLLRALCSEMSPWERVGTIETEHELHLHELSEQHKRIIAWEARPGSGERGPDGKPAGEITVADITYGSWRANLSRLIVGEVRGHEVLSMFEAMQGGAGSMSTTHANAGRAAVERLVTLSVKSGAPVDFAYRQVAEHIDLIVQISVDVVENPDGTAAKQRFVSEVVAVEPGERGMPAYTDVFREGRDGRAVPGILPYHFTALARHGFDLSSYDGVIGDPQGPDGRAGRLA